MSFLFSLSLNHSTRQLSAAFLALSMSWVLSYPTLAAPEPEATVNPLEMTEPDPLLPVMVIDRPLSPQEQSVLAAATDELRNQAEAKFRAGDLPGAFEIWNRELRLRRVLGTAQEVESLSRVGEIAWSQTQTTEVRVITQRLQVIEQDLQQQTPLNYDLLMKIAEAYQKMRAQAPAVALYEQLLAQAQQQKNIPEQQKILTALGDLHQSWFDYPNAIAAYKQLLALARTKADGAAEELYLQKLAILYQENEQPDEAIAMQQKLVDIYTRKQELNLIPSLKMAMGDSYLAAQRPDLAATNYQEAFAVSRSIQQYGYASEALQRLASLYRSLARLEDVLVVYQLLLDVQQQSYDTLGIMNTYDQIGQIQRTQGNNPQAAASFRQGLQLAQQLKYKVGYFLAQLQEVSP
ncbi:MAG: tetratricopeptide repeat protein [Timaviella obliquedivisa GSE-PSE-MK23-08B]|nr:tetratricopeptide repeat protein [Timaviella obliquedivisa GSE-PSE-MK23-08B]